MLRVCTYVRTYVLRLRGCGLDYKCLLVVCSSNVWPPARPPVAAAPPRPSTPPPTGPACLFAPHLQLAHTHRQGRGGRAGQGGALAAAPNEHGAQRRPQGVCGPFIGARGGMPRRLRGTLYEHACASSYSSAGWVVQRLAVQRVAATLPLLWRCNWRGLLSSAEQSWPCSYGD